MTDIQALATRQKRPVKIMQYGEGNFLRAFVDYFVDVANEKGILDTNIAIVKPIPQGNLTAFAEQDNFYTVLLRGKLNGQLVTERRIVTSVEKVIDPFSDYEAYISLSHSGDLKFIVSNTTEAGIAFDGTDTFGNFASSSFPAKVTMFLYERFCHFGESMENGLIFLPVELIDKNGACLRECVLRYCRLWNLSEDFVRWVKECNIFCSTLVDRIVTGYPKEDIESLEESINYRDRLLDTGEPFALWVIESDRLDEIKKEFPLDRAGLPVIFTEDITPYRERKVRILNGAHTGTVLAAACAGYETVGECMQSPVIRGYMEKLVCEEIAPTVLLPRKEVHAFAACVFERFENPFIRHMLSSIALNSVSKWKTRILPGLKDYLRLYGKLPMRLTFSFAALYHYYMTFPMRDSAAVVEFFQETPSVLSFMKQIDFWGEDLSLIPGFVEKVSEYIGRIAEMGIVETMKFEK